MPSPGVRFLYVPVRSLEPMRRFYSDLVGLDEIYFVENDALGYNCDGFQFTFLFDADAPAPAAGWATQPGWDGDTVAAVSWSIELTEGDFRAAVQRLRDADVAAHNDAPQWQGYWSFPVRDPAGHTCEVVWSPADFEPQDWPVA